MFLENLKYHLYFGHFVHRKYHSRKGFLPYEPISFSTKILAWQSQGKFAWSTPLPSCLGLDPSVLSFRQFSFYQIVIHSDTDNKRY